MTQKMILEIETKKPLNAYKDGFIIVRDDARDKYVAVEKEDFFSQINKRIDKISNDYESLKKYFLCIKETLEENYKNFTEDNHKKFNDFLLTYQKTNAKIIDMVKAFAENKD